MAAEVLSGKEMSESLRKEIAERVVRLKEQGVTPGLAVILVGNDPASEIYVRNKGNGCAETGMYSRTMNMPEETTQEQLEAAIEELNADPAIHGILVQLPLPKHLDENAALAKILPEKDVDGFHLINAGHMLTGTEGVVACTPRGALYMIKSTGLDLRKLQRAAVHFKSAVSKMEKEGLISSKVLRVDPNTLLYQVPGGMLSNLLSQLKEAGAEERLEEVLEEVPRVRKDFGYPPLVTPTSQIVGSQAVLNVLIGRYATFTKESRGLLGGEYGELPGTVNEEVRKKAIGESELITCRPADLLEPELVRIKQQYSDIAKTEEDVLSCAMFPQVAPEFIRRRDDLVVHEIEVEWV